MKLSSFLQMKPNLFIYRKLGWKIALYYIMILGRLYFWLKHEEKQKIVSSLESVFSGCKNEFEIREIRRKVFRGIYAHYYEKLFNAYEGIAELKSFMEESIVPCGFKKLNAALERGRGVLFVTGHYGGIEYIPIYLAARGYPISVLAKFATEQLKETLHEKTKPLGLKIIDVAQNPRVLAQTIEELRANRVVFIECDEIEEWKPSDKEKTFFLGKMVGVDRTLNVIVRRTGAEIVLGVLHRYNLQEYALIIEDHHDILSRVDESLSSVGEAVLKSLEQLVYYDPEQWYQWKKYAEIEETEVKHPSPRGAFVTPILRPACVDAT